MRWIERTANSDATKTLPEPIRALPDLKKSLLHLKKSLLDLKQRSADHIGKLLAFSIIERPDRV